MSGHGSPSEADISSDVDFLIDYDLGSEGLGPLIDLRHEFSRILGCPVDVAVRGLLREPVATSAFAEAKIVIVRPTAVCPKSILRMTTRQKVLPFGEQRHPSYQAIPHVHFHVAGTLPECGTEWGNVNEESVAETDAIGERMRPLLYLPPNWGRFFS